MKPNDHPFGGQELNASSLGWAMSAVSSRAFRLHGKKLAAGTRNEVPMMLPLIDMCNHSFNPNAQIIQDEDDSQLLIKAGPNLLLLFFDSFYFLKRNIPCFLCCVKVNVNLSLSLFP